MNQIRLKDKLENNKSIKILAFDPAKNSTKPHKHNGYLELVYLSSTSGKHWIDGKEAIVQAPCLLIIRKDNVHHWELTNPVEGFVVLVKDSFITESYDFELGRLVRALNPYHTIYLAAGETYFGQVLSLLAQETNRLGQEGLFKAFLSKVVESIVATDLPKLSTVSLYDQFCALLDKEPRVLNHVAYYAAKLHTSPQNLNAICKKNTGKTASQLLAVYIIQEAKRLLIYTNSTVSEIAFALGFSDKSNFAKYFKRYVGVTPTAFKQSTD